MRNPKSNAVPGLQRHITACTARAKMGKPCSKLRALPARTLRRDDKFDMFLLGVHSAAGCESAATDPWHGHSWLFGDVSQKLQAYPASQVQIYLLLCILPKRECRSVLTCDRHAVSPSLVTARGQSERGVPSVCTSPTARHLNVQ